MILGCDSKHLNVFHKHDYTPEEHMSFITTLIAIFAAGFGFGVVLPVTSVILEQQHVATPTIGLMATIMFVGLALGRPACRPQH